MTEREKRLERALLVIEGLTLEHTEIENELAGAIYTIAHGASDRCCKKCPHVLNHDSIIKDYVSGLKQSGIMDIEKIQGA